MTLHRLLAMVVVVGLGLIVAAPAAEACGVWHLDDLQRGAKVSYYITTASVLKGKKRLGAIYIVESEHGLQVARDGKVWDDIRDGKLLRRGKKVGTVDSAAGSVTIGRTTYVIALSNRGEMHGAPSWHVEVTRGDTVIARGEAMSLCDAMHKDPPLTEAQLEDEVRRRVIYYLAWRDVRR